MALLRGSIAEYHADQLLSCAFSDVALQA